MGFTAAQLNAINPHLVPLIAHDRAGFGGVLASCGLTVLLMVWKARPAPAMWQALLVGGITGFGCAIGVHFGMHYLVNLPPDSSRDRRSHLRRGSSLPASPAAPITSSKG